MEAKNLLAVIGLICLAFFGIPIHIDKKNEPSQDIIEFNSYIRRYNKSYGSNRTEYLIRFENFKASLKQIEELNKNRTNNDSALYGLTIYSDMSRDEFMQERLQSNISLHPAQTHSSEEKYEKFKKKIKKKLKKLKKYIEKVNNTIISNFAIENRVKRGIIPLPKKIDWREKGVISGVRNQRTCGACWAFSTVQTVEAMNAIKTGKLQSLSVQEMIDCAKNGNYGCEGGDSCSLLDWLISSNIQIYPEKTYPLSYETQTCRLKPPKDGGVKVKGYSCDNFTGNEDLLLDKLANHGPVAVAVNAINWQFYLGGVIQFHCSGSPENLNHAVQIVGYDQTASVPHYIIRNSWGVEFGDKGYIYIAIGKNICGIANEISSLDVF